MTGESSERVSVVLATYNGARYLPAFLASLAAQTRRPTILVVRDDGSRDGSVDIVRQWARGERVELKVIEGGRLGPAKSFLVALAEAPGGGVSLLADQDDVWLPDKIERSLRALEAVGSSGPALYASRLTVVDDELRPLRPSVTPRRLNFASAACENVLTGCTMALNEPLRLLAARAAPDDVIMHDWWLYLLATAAGVVVFDDAPTLLYRQHQANAIGAGPEGLKAAVLRLKRLIRGGPGLRSRQLRALVETFEDAMSPAAVTMARELLAAEASVGKRLRVAWMAPIERQRWPDRVATRFSILAGRY